MNKRAISLLVVSLLLTLSAHAADLREIHIGQRFISPDRRFATEIKDEDERGYNLEIKDQNNGKAYKAAASLPLFSFEWTTDSKTIVLLEHIGGGSQISLIHFNGHEWKRREIEPPGGNSGHYEVLEKDIGKNFLRISYKVTKEKQNGTVFGAYKCSLRVDASNGQISHVEKQDISIDAYRTLHYKE
jgi:hypothetical protein